MLNRKTNIKYMHHKDIAPIPKGDQPKNSIQHRECHTLPCGGIQHQRCNIHSPLVENLTKIFTSGKSKQSVKNKRFLDETNRATQFSEKTSNAKIKDFREKSKIFIGAAYTKQSFHTNQRFVDQEIEDFQCKQRVHHSRADDLTKLQMMEQACQNDDSCQTPLINSKKIVQDTGKNSEKRKISAQTDTTEVIFSAKETYYYKMINKFFKKTDKKNTEQMLTIINGDSKLSLRLLDWFVTRYAKKYKTFYYIGDDNERFNVHISYKAQLKSYKKRYFDPFRRRKKFFYAHDRKNNNNKLYTTIGQLNFFRWAISNNVIQHVEKHYDDIIEAMVQSNKEDKLRKQKNISKKKPTNATIRKQRVIIRAKKKN